VGRATLPAKYAFARQRYSETEKSPSCLEQWIALEYIRWSQEGDISGNHLSLHPLFFVVDDWRFARGLSTRHVMPKAN
jgi:hypothetical protein